MRSLNTMVTTLLTVLMIYIFGVTSIRQFILPLIVGLIAGVFSSVCLAGNFWSLFQGKKREMLSGELMPAKAKPTAKERNKRVI